ncbi:DUF4252 domain-containing protein [Rufibacter sp. LB8]|uniref:DUF4252 domain-containing protein n=1 Tax=Rufibacter sp. LB8 TaxID=2777781 RepID=UPI00178C21D1|nr:DUF4252 domain-containing protein [Rufibacter sp. LB8]
MISENRKLATKGLLLLMTLALALTVGACSGTSSLPPAQTTTDFYQKYKSEPGFKGTSVPVGLVTRYLSNEVSDTTMLAALANLTSVRVLTFTPTNKRAQRLLEKGLTQELDQVLQKENYAALPMLDAAPGTLQFRMRQTGEQVQELVGYRKYGNSFLMLQVNGRFTRSQVEMLLQKIDPELLLPLLG